MAPCSGVRSPVPLPFGHILSQYRPLLIQLATFLGVGFTALFFHFLVLSALVEWEVVGPVSASLVGFVVGSCVTYTLNSRFTFKSTRSHAGAMPRYFAVAGVAFVLNGVLMDVFVHRLGVFYLLAQFLTSALVLCWTFTGYRVWAFAEKRPRPEAS
jgi:putative flippase GtrA